MTAPRAWSAWRLIINSNVDDGGSPPSSTLRNKNMEFAVNYSPALAQLVRAGQVRVDRFKCPAWPDLIAEAAALLPVYVHLPLEIGWGRGIPLDVERKRAVDLEWLAELLSATGTWLINTHFQPAEADYPEIPPGSLQSRYFRPVLDAALRDLEPLIARFGAERVTVENCIGDYGKLQLSSLPEIFHPLLGESGCGFLFDLSHARMAAQRMGIDERAYSSAMPMQHLRELHITGIQVIEGHWLERLQAAGDSDGVARNLAGQPLDHFPMLPADWTELEWAIDQIRAGAWQKPWVAAYEYGGVGGFFEAITDRDVLLDQVPRMAGLIAHA
jgi:uncharacterized protein